MNKQYEQWLAQWMLLNPKPLQKDNKFVIVSLWAMVISVLILTGARTSVIMIETKTITELALLLGVTNNLIFFTRLEAFMSFVGIDFGLIMLGLILGESTSKNKVIPFSLGFLLVITILGANLKPVMVLTSYYEQWFLLVSFLMVISNVFLSVFGSSMIASIQNNKILKFEAKLKAWEQTKKDEWNKEQVKIKRRETRLNTKKDKPVKIEQKKDKDNTNLEGRIIEQLKADGTLDISLLVRKLNADFEPVTIAVKNLVQDKKLKTHNGSSVKLQN